MHFERAESALPRDTDSVLPRRRRIDKDEAILSRFGRNQ